MIQIGGGFHRYSVDERWCVPHFEKMSYDNSELLKNYLHGYQSTGNARYLEVVEGTIAWVRQVLSDQSRGGFYASQDADQTLDDDGDYFTWTVAEAREVLSPDEWRVAELYYDIGARGEMHHNPEKNVLWRANSVDEIAKKLKLSQDTDWCVGETRPSLAPRKLPRWARLARRPTPAVDETLYVGWNAMFVSAYLEASRTSWIRGWRRTAAEFALKTLNRILAEAWDPTKGFPPPHRRYLHSKVRSMTRCLRLLLRCLMHTKPRSICDISNIAGTSDATCRRTLRRSRWRRIL